MRKRVTLTEVARLSGVSRQVVSAIVAPARGGSVRYSPETFGKVMKIVDAMGFRPNRTARNLVNNRHGNIGVLIREYGLVWGDTLRHILCEAHKFGQVVVLDYFPEDGSGLPSIIKEDAVDGLIIFEDIDVAVLSEVDHQGIPCVRVNTNIRNLPGTITFSEQSAMRIAVDLFVRKDRRDLAMLASSGDHYSQRLRKKGFLMAARSAGLSPPSTVFIDNAYSTHDYQSQLDEIRRLFRKRPGVNGVLLSEDRMAPALYKVAAELGKHIPKDLAVIGVNNSLTAVAVSPSLTSLYVNSEEVGLRAVQMLNELIDDLPNAGKPYKCEYDIVEREST